MVLVREVLRLGHTMSREPPPLLGMSVLDAAGPSPPPHRGGSGPSTAACPRSGSPQVSAVTSRGLGVGLNRHPSQPTVKLADRLADRLAGAVPGREGAQGMPVSQKWVR